MGKGWAEMSRKVLKSGNANCRLDLLRKWGFTVKILSALNVPEGGGVVGPTEATRGGGFPPGKAWDFPFTFFILGGGRVRGGGRGCIFFPLILWIWSDSMISFVKTVNMSYASGQDTTFYDVRKLIRSLVSTDLSRSEHTLLPPLRINPNEPVNHLGKWWVPNPQRAVHSLRHHLHPQAVPATVFPLPLTPLFHGDIYFGNGCCTLHATSAFPWLWECAGYPARHCPLC